MPAMPKKASKKVSKEENKTKSKLAQLKPFVLLTKSKVLDHAASWSKLKLLFGATAIEEDNKSNIPEKEKVIKSIEKLNKTKKAQINQLLKIDFPSFAAILPYRYYDTERNLFVNKESLGFGLELGVLAGADEKIINGIADIFRFKLDDDYDIQFIFSGSNKVGELIENAVSKQRKSDQNTQKSTQKSSMAEELGKTASQYYEQAAISGFKNRRGVAASLRDYRLFCFVSKKTPWSEEAAANLLQQRDALTAEFEAVDISYDRIHLPGFLSLLRSLINHDRAHIRNLSSRHEEYTPLNEQIVDKSVELKVMPDNLELYYGGAVEKETVVTNLSLRTLPDRFALWMGADNFCNVFRMSQAIRCPFIISMHARLIPQAQAKTRAQSRYLSMEKKAKSVYAKYISGTGETAAEWKKIRDDLANDEVKLAETWFNVTLFSRPDEAKRNESAAISCFRYNGIELFNTRYLQLQSFLATLPFTLTEGLFSDLKKAGRIKTITSWNLANLLPLMADYKLGYEGILLPTLRNQIAFFDPFSKSLPVENHNIAVAATSGAGKSFFIQTLLNYTNSIGGKCFVIDIGHSYRKLCNIMGGKYLEYHNLRLNPFSHIHSIEESAEQIRDLLAVLASPAGELDDVQEEYLRNAAIIAWENKKNEANIDDVIEALKVLNSKRHDHRISDLITLLDRYGTKGAYPEIFNEYSDIAPKENFVVLELGELANKPSLMKAVLFALMLSIEEQMYHSPRNQPKMVVIDEAWQLLSGDNKAAARFIEKGYRTARRHLGSFVTITQGIDDFMQSNEAKACWNCSAIKVIMLQNAQAFNDFVKGHENYFTPYTERLIRGFSEAKSNGFSEFMLQIGQIQSFHRLFVDPFSRVMFSSEGREFNAVQEYVNQGMTIKDAILQVAKENYGDEFAVVQKEQSYG